MRKQVPDGTVQSQGVDTTARRDAERYVVYCWSGYRGEVGDEVEKGKNSEANVGGKKRDNVRNEE